MGDRSSHWLGMAICGQQDHRAGAVVGEVRLSQEPDGEGEVGGTAGSSDLLPGGSGGRQQSPSSHGAPTAMEL